LLKYIRYIILSASILFAVGIYFAYGMQQYGGIIKTYALIAFSLIYLSLLIGPFYDAFRNAPGRAILTRSRRAIGVSAFLFAMLHANFAFFGQLGGIKGLGYLPEGYVTPLLLGFIALCILTLMALTSFDFWVKRLGKGWKYIHRFIYLAGWLILYHAFTLGSDFAAPDGVVARLAILAVSFLLVLHALRLDTYLIRRKTASAQYGSLFVILTATIIAVAYSYLSVVGGPDGVSIHSQHTQLAKENQSAAALPGTTGDKTKRYNVQLNQRGNDIAFQVTDAANGNPVTLFSTIFGKPVHLIVVSADLAYFEHLHPDVKGNTFTATIPFPATGAYRLYLDFQPIGAIEQQFAFLVSSTGSGNLPPLKPVSYETTKVFGDYEVVLEKPAILSAKQLSVGGQQLTFTVRDAANKQPVTTLQPYLASFGHLVMIRQGGYEYIHVHPADPTTPAVGSTGGPSVSFLPLGIYGQIKPGVYRVFAQFNPDGQLFTADFWVEVKE
jgi:DMSO/TMAO reductase YedYZ heme-binding membrane subunit